MVVGAELSTRWQKGIDGPSDYMVPQNIEVREYGSQTPPPLCTMCALQSFSWTSMETDLISTGVNNGITSMEVAYTSEGLCASLCQDYTIGSSGNFNGTEIFEGTSNHARPFRQEKNLTHNFTVTNGVGGALGSGLGFDPMVYWSMFHDAINVGYGRTDDVNTGFTPGAYKVYSNIDHTSSFIFVVPGVDIEQQGDGTVLRTIDASGANDITTSDFAITTTATFLDVEYTLTSEQHSVIINNSLTEDTHHWEGLYVGGGYLYNLDTQDTYFENWRWVYAESISVRVLEEGSLDIPFTRSYKNDYIIPTFFFGRNEQYPMSQSQLDYNNRHLLAQRIEDLYSGKVSDEYEEKENFWRVSGARIYLIYVPYNRELNFPQA